MRAYKNIHIDIHLNPILKKIDFTQGPALNWQQTTLKQVVNLLINIYKPMYYTSTLILLENIV